MLVHKAPKKFTVQSEFVERLLLVEVGVSDMDETTWLAPALKLATSQVFFIRRKSVSLGDNELPSGNPQAPFAPVAAQG